ncbi:MAG: hypothetical protein ACRDPY_51005, partial [Streptosporangiaceae bacterium]
MTSTLTPTCSVCGLRFDNRPLLELHAREDHLERGNAPDPSPGNPAGSPASRLRNRSPASGRSEPPAASRAETGPGTAGP